MIERADFGSPPVIPSAPVILSEAKNLPPASPSPRRTPPDGIDCPLCENRGYLTRVDETGRLFARECECMSRRRSLRQMRRSGLADLLETNTFKTYRIPDEWTKSCKAAALNYVENGRGRWFYHSGKPGTGKTHLCTAICGKLLKRGEEVRYLLWREEVPELKALVQDAAAYKARMDELSSVPVLYIDDFFKGNVSPADLNLAFALLNARYNRHNTRTILSSELPLSEIRRMDEAIGSRIYERAKGYILHAPPDARNWRTT